MNEDDPTEIDERPATVPIHRPDEEETELASAESPQSAATRIVETRRGGVGAPPTPTPRTDVGAGQESTTVVSDPSEAPFESLPANDDHTTGQRLLGRYLIGEKIGSGGFGSVYRATDELKASSGEDAEIAVKIINASKIGNRLNALIQEVSRSHQVSHPNIVRVYDIHSDQGLAFITMELLEGQTLADRLTAAGLSSEDRRNRLPVEEVDALVRSVCGALSHCHDQNIVHADIKPANIFLSSNGTVKLLDLGISQLRGSRGKISGYSASYSSPQQMSGEAADPRDDLFALGCVLYECLTGDRSFEGQTSQAALSSGRHFDSSGLPRRYRRALAGVLELSRDDRTSTADQLWKQINPAIPKRNLAVAIAATITLGGFIAATLLGIGEGKKAIAVSRGDQRAAEAAYRRAIEIVETNPGESRSALVEAIQTNPYHEQAARRLAEIVEEAPFSRPQRYSLIWADYELAVKAAPTSEALQAVGHARIDQILVRDLSPLSRSRLLTEYRAPLCVLVKMGYRADELERLRTDLSIRC